MLYHRIIEILLYVVVSLCWMGVQTHNTGNAAGLMADCPGMNRSTLLSEETKRSLTVVVVYPTTSLFGYRETRCKLDRGATCAGRVLNLSRKTIVVISGYLDATFSPIVRTFIAHYISEGCNVIVLENFPILVRSYPLAARVTKPLGELLGEFLASLTQQGLPSSQLHLIGASLGAHIASRAATVYAQLTGQRPARLTGLDPAGPCFRNMPPTERLHAAAAQQVDVLHTNIDGFGIAEPLGHVDFYANGGEYQPYIKGSFIMPCFQLCSHVRSALYWLVAATNPKKFVAVKCDSVANARHGDCFEGTLDKNVLGPRTNFNKTGVYYLPTYAVPPFYLGAKGLKKRRYGVNDYLLKTAADEDIILK